MTAYKADFALSNVFNMVFFIIYFVLWKTIYNATGAAEISSYSLSNTITYYFIIAIIFRFELDNAMYLGEEIWNGQFSNDLIKPWNVKIVHLLATMADVGLSVLVSIPLFILLFIMAHSYINFLSFTNLFFFLVTLVLGFFLNLVVYFILHSLTFFFGDQDANIKLASYLIVFFAGGFFPLAFLPLGLKGIFQALPFKFLFDIPANIFLGKLSTMEILSSWGQMVFWILIFYLVFHFLFKHGLKKYTGVGR